MSPEYRGRLKPGKGSSLVGMIVGLGFLIFGLAMFSDFGPAGMGPPPAFILLWVVVTIGITAFNAYNYFSDKGVSVIDVDFELPGRNAPFAAGGIPGGGPADDPAPRVAPEADFDVRLRKLQSLRDDGLITEEEFQRKRAEIIAERW